MDTLLSDLSLDEFIFRHLHKIIEFFLWLKSIFFLTSQWVSWLLYKVIFLWLNLSLRPICRRGWNCSWNIFMFNLFSVFSVASWSVVTLCSVYLWLNLYLRSICRQYWNYIWTYVYIRSISWFLSDFHSHSIKWFIFGWIYISDPFAQNRWIFFG